jgi:hypothetical protein
MPYHSGILIDSIAPSTEADDSSAQLQCKEAYQSLIGSISWLALTTCSNHSAAHVFLSSYSNKPAVCHMKAALYVLHYIHLTNDYGISFMLDYVAPMHSYIHYPPSSDAKAYTDAISPKVGNSSTLSAYSNVCWGSQTGSAVTDSTLFPLFKFCSMNGGIIFKNGSLIGWLCKHQECTSLSSCKAEIQATNATSKKVIDFCNLSWSVSKSGSTLLDINPPSVLCNNNDACVKQSYPKQPGIYSFAKVLSASGSKTRLLTFAMLPAKSTRPTNSQKKCRMALTFNISVILSCLLYWTY